MAGPTTSTAKSPNPTFRKTTNPAAVFRQPLPPDSQPPPLLATHSHSHSDRLGSPRLQLHPTQPNPTSSPSSSPSSSLLHSVPRAHARTQLPRPWRGEGGREEEQNEGSWGSGWSGYGSARRGCPNAELSWQDPWPPRENPRLVDSPKALAAGWSERVGQPSLLLLLLLPGISVSWICGCFLQGFELRFWGDLIFFSFCRSHLL